MTDSFIHMIQSFLARKLFFRGLEDFNLVSTINVENTQTLTIGVIADETRVGG